MERSSGSTQPIIEINILLVLVAVLAGFIVVGPLIGILIALPFYEGSIMDFMSALSDPISNPGVKIPFYIVQGCSTLFGLIIVPALLVVAKRQPLIKLMSVPNTQLTAYLIVAFSTISFMLVNSPFIEWNANLTFPEFMKGFEEWAKTREEYAGEVTSFLTTFSNRGELILALFVIAVLPAFGEELVFRGLLQPQLNKHTGNIHAAIWITAILFSAMHMQFYGFVPRMLLGGLFGYLYYWSGNLWVAILAHFVNNGFSVLMLYLYQQKVSELDMNSTESAPWPVVAGAAMISFALLYIFKKQVSNTTPA
ncbi:CPBP family intramembrane metalloprotease [Chryseotalea sanaruensis]|uniref:CPBP family intramembrane metalloprotease n=1 Tax=Chryseotalea sanaruensis TaxID=2482724 RepID=A0A401UB23_9BACT|nr:CPBP family intramembrane glutamic endopeptidase [Chryseotalea sanaruensis]GCC52081.1 CPBP family intramembrane metalloprotease [Chryseotalea sanaruensis]